ncbi:MAG: hypothetical protein LBQ61_05630 [Spirochaetales bacterium]|jgi:hypothetical protein|nr:hypothetical protein [Spirochaetales bacterium]
MKKILLIFLALAAALGTAYAQSSRDDVIDMITPEVDDNFADALELLIPGLDWLPVMNLGQNLFSASYIGQIYPGFPQFTLGANIGLSSNNASRTLYDVAAGEMEEGTLPLLALLAADVRLGGYYLPFDIGFSVMSLPLDATSILGKLGEGLGLTEATKVSAEFTALGVDLRYRIIEEGYGLALLPHAPRSVPEDQWWYALIPSVSAGLGYNYYHLALRVEGYTTETGKPQIDSTVDIGFGVHSGYASLQVSKKIFFAEPFTGIKLGLSSSAMDLDLQTISRLNEFSSGNWLDHDYGRTGEEDRGAVFTPVWYWGVSFQLGIMGLFHIQLDLANSYDLSRAEEGKPGAPLGFNLGFRLRR